MATKYPVLYPSSKGQLEIEGMATPHIKNALRKMLREVADPFTDPVCNALTDELQARGASLSDEAPPKEE
jgi:hypothetical protein